MGPSEALPRSVVVVPSARRARSWGRGVGWALPLVVLVGCEFPDYRFVTIYGDGSLEACANGIDDDGNGLADCDDVSACACGGAYAMQEWTGPVAVSFTAADAPEPSCAALDRYPLPGPVFGRAPVADDATCKACRCDVPAGFTCSAQVRYWGQTSAPCGPGNCMPVGGCLRGVEPNSCERFDLAYQGDGAGIGPTSSVELVVELDGEGSCAQLPAEGVEEFPAPTFSESAVVCGARENQGENLACEGRFCAWRPERELGFQACIYRTGDTACPSGGNYVRQVYYLAPKDDRSCSPCGCDAPEGIHCEALGRDYEADENCGGFGTDVVQNSCSAVLNPTEVGSDIRHFELLEIGLSEGGSCSASGGVLEGEIGAEGPVTLCCVP